MLMRCRLLALAVAVGSAGAEAEMDADDYGAPRSPRGAAERARVEAQVEADRAADRNRSEREAREEAGRRLIAAVDTRPYPARLTEERCTECHGSNLYAHSAHTRIGWEFVALRMAWLNDAHFEPGERSAIAAHLASTQGAGALRAVGEYALLASLAFLPIGAVLRAMRAARHRPRA